MEQSVSRMRAVGGGIVAGIVGGLVIKIIGVLMTASAGGDVWVALKASAAPFLGARAMQPGPDALAVFFGLVSHFAVSIVWGVLFGVLFFGVSRGATVLLGALWGIVVWLGMYYVVLPLIGMSAIARGAPLGPAIFLHIVFGLFVGLGFLPYQRRRLPLGAAAETPAQRSTRGGRDLEPPGTHPPT